MGLKEGKAKAKAKDSKMTQLSTDFECLFGEVSGLESATMGIQPHSKEISAVKVQIAGVMSDPVVEELSTELNEL
jgi:hypothetical protein